MNIQNEDNQTIILRLQQLEGSEDEVSRKERIECLFTLKRYELICQLAPDYLATTQHHYYPILYRYLQSLLECNQTVKIEDLLVEELKMPYIPAPYSHYFLQLYQDLNRKKKQEQKTTNPYILSTDYELNQALTSMKDKEKLLMVLDELSRRNIRTFLPVLTTKLFDSIVPNFIKVAILELLKDQEVRKLFKVTVKGVICEVNPCDLTPLLQLPTITEVMELLQPHVHKDIGLNELIQSLLIAYLASIYPLEVGEDEHLFLAAALYWMANRDLGQMLSQVEVSMQFGIRTEMLVHFIEEVSQMHLFF